MRHKVSTVAVEGGGVVAVGVSGHISNILNCESGSWPPDLHTLHDMFGSVWVAALIRFPAGWILSFAAANSPHHIVATCRSSLDQIRLPRDIRLWKSNWVRIASYRWLSDPLSMMPNRPRYNWQSLFTIYETRSWQSTRNRRPLGQFLITC